MGRPKVDEPRQPYTVMLKPSVVKEIDRISAIRGRFTRSEFMSNLIDMGLEDLQTLDKLGLIQAVAVGDRVLKKLRETMMAGDLRLNNKGDLEIRK